MFLKNFSIKADNISACVKINRNGHMLYLWIMDVTRKKMLSAVVSLEPSNISKFKR